MNTVRTSKLKHYQKLGCRLWQTAQLEDVPAKGIKRLGYLPLTDYVIPKGDVIKSNFPIIEIPQTNPDKASKIISTANYEYLSSEFEDMGGLYSSIGPKGHLLCFDSRLTSSHDPQDAKFVRTLDTLKRYPVLDIQTYNSIKSALELEVLEEWGIAEVLEAFIDLHEVEIECPDLKILLPLIQRTIEQHQIPFVEDIDQTLSIDAASIARLIPLSEMYKVLAIEQSQTRFLYVVSDSLSLPRGWATCIDGDYQDLKLTISNGIQQLCLSCKDVQADTD